MVMSEHKSVCVGKVPTLFLLMWYIYVALCGKSIDMRLWRLLRDIDVSWYVSMLPVCVSDTSHL